MTVKCIVDVHCFYYNQILITDTRMFKLKRKTGNTALHCLIYICTLHDCITNLHFLFAI